MAPGGVQNDGGRALMLARYLYKGRRGRRAADGTAASRTRRRRVALIRSSPTRVRTRLPTSSAPRGSRSFLRSPSTTPMSRWLRPGRRERQRRRRAPALSWKAAMRHLPERDRQGDAISRDRSRSPRTLDPRRDARAVRGADDGARAARSCGDWPADRPGPELVSRN